MRTSLVIAILAIGMAGSNSRVIAQAQSSGASGSPSATGAKPASAVTPAVVRTPAEDRLEGEKRFRDNCSRCHQTPHKFSPRAMATILRHMRVRATLTDEDARLILKYMSQ
jgi:mono/diheme cytochrome c family protein